MAQEANNNGSGLVEEEIHFDQLINELISSSSTPQIHSPVPSLPLPSTHWYSSTSQSSSSSTPQSTSSSTPQSTSSSTPQSTSSSTPQSTYSSSSAPQSGSSSTPQSISSSTSQSISSLTPQTISDSSTAPQSISNSSNAPQSIFAPVYNTTHTPVHSRFAKPKTNEQVIEARKNAVPQKTQKDTLYCIRVWDAWRANINSCYSSSVPVLLEMDLKSLEHWLPKFVLEATKVDGSEYPPNTLHHIICGIMRHLRSNSQPGIDFFKDIEFASLRSSLDAEMKRLRAKGLGSALKQAEPLTLDEEELLWENKILGDHSPISLLNTMIFIMASIFPCEVVMSTET